MEQNHCGHLGLPIDTNLAGFDPEVIFLLQSKFRLKATKGLERMSKINFQDGGWGGYLGFSIRSVLAILCLLGALMLIINFQFSWIIQAMSKIWILNIFPI